MGKGLNVGTYTTKRSRTGDVPAHLHSKLKREVISRCDLLELFLYDITYGKTLKLVAVINLQQTCDR